jgi:hypothetical protein
VFFISEIPGKSDSAADTKKEMKTKSFSGDIRLLLPGIVLEWE